MIAGAVIGALATLGLGSAAAVATLRHRSYRRRVCYDVGQNQVLGMAGPGIETQTARCSMEGIILSQPLSGPASAFLEIDVRTTIAGRLADPAIEVEADGFRDIQYFERGAQGARFVNLSRLLSSRTNIEQVRLRGRGITWREGEARLHVCRESLAAEDRVLVVAPHPDDAEIAAFGLYAASNATVVTLTAGDASDRYHNPGQPWLSLPRGVVARLRVWDSLTVPQLGGVPADRAINLCAPDGQLAQMQRHPDYDLQGRNREAFDFAALRQMNRSPLVRPAATCSWKSLVGDLSAILAAAEPTVVIAPHPVLDPHSDHLFSTLAAVEALQMAGVRAPRMFLYAVHNRRSELWPFGPAGSGVALLPVFPGDGCCASAFYSHGLSRERQRDKFLALEAMHDVRDIHWPESAPGKDAAHHLRRHLRAAIHRMGSDPTSYLRRAVRPDEVFFVTSLEECRALIERAIAERRSPRAAA
jgi:LmbE family N-acetylglucosaminyl deacetylase